MEEIKTIRQKTFELKQYANAILADLEKTIEEEQDNFASAINKITEDQDKEIKLLNDRIEEKECKIKEMEREIKEKENENSKLMSVIDRAKEVMSSAINICEGVE